MNRYLLCAIFGAAFSLQPALADTRDDVYVRDVLCIPQRIYVTQSWSLINKPNVGMHGHSHSNSVLSGSLYYCELPSPPSNMVFTRHVSYRQIDLPPEPGKRSIYNSPVTRVMPKQDDIFLFSSRLSHMVEPDASAQRRHSIAFNTFVKGKLGNCRDVSELVLS